MKNTFILALFLSIGLLSCKSTSEDQVKPDAIREEVITSTNKDIEFQQSALSYQYLQSINERTNQTVGTRFDKEKITLDINSIRQPIEAFIQAHPTSYKLYFRLELREFKADLLQPDGTKIIQAGGVYGTPGGKGDFFGAAGTLFSTAERPYSWEEVSSDLASQVQELFAPAEVMPMKLMVAVYDYNRWLNDTDTINKSFDGSIEKSYEQGSSRIIYRGWNVEIK